MGIRYGFFNSVGGDRKYDADDISNYFVKLISDGVFATPANAMQVQTGGGMQLTVTAGWAFIKCRWFSLDAVLPLTVDAADMVLSRVDRVVVRLDMSNRLMEIAIKKGTPGSSSPPALTRVEGGIWEISLAQVAVPGGTVALTQANITDERADTSVCGFVTGLIDQIDTTDLFTQYNTAFSTWFESIKDAVKATTIVISMRSKYTTTGASTNTIPIGISGYNPTLDILNVYVNGIRVTAYTSDEYYIYLTDALTVSGTEVDIEVLKSVDTEDAQSAVEFMVQLSGRVAALEANAVTRPQLENRLNGLLLIKMSEADYAALATHDANTIYYVYDSKGDITQYMGDIALTSGRATAGAMTALAAGTTDSVQGEATYHQGG
jgi:hypothetical protein